MSKLNFSLHTDDEIRTSRPLKRSVPNIPGTRRESFLPFGLGDVAGRGLLLDRDLFAILFDDGDGVDQPNMYVQQIEIKYEQISGMGFVYYWSYSKQSIFIITYTNRND